MKKALLTLAASLALIFSVSGCGIHHDATMNATMNAGANGSKGAAKSGESEVVGGERIEKVDYLAALVPEKIRATGQLKIATNATYAPAQFTDTDGTIIGFEVDLAKAVAAVLGLDPVMQFAEFDSIIPALGEKYDVGASTFTITTAREQAVNLVQSFTSGEQFAVQAGNPKGLVVSDSNPDNVFSFLCGHTIAVESQTTQDYELSDEEGKCRAAGLPNWKLLRYDSQALAGMAVAEGKADVTYSDTPVIEYEVQQFDGKLEVLGKSVNVAPVGFAINKNDMALTIAIREATQHLIDNGEYAAILKKWNALELAVPFAHINPKLEAKAEENSPAEMSEMPADSAETPTDIKTTEEGEVK